MCDVTTSAYVDVGAGVGGEVGAGVGAAVGDGVGLHAQTSCPKLRAYALSCTADPSRNKPAVPIRRCAPSVQASKLRCGRLRPSTLHLMGPNGPTARTMLCGARAARTSAWATRSERATARATARATVTGCAYIECEPSLVLALSRRSRTCTPVCAHHHAASRRCTNRLPFDPRVTRMSSSRYSQSTHPAPAPVGTGILSGPR